MKHKGKTISPIENIDGNYLNPMGHGFGVGEGSYEEESDMVPKEEFDELADK